MTTLKTRILSRGKSVWKLTRFSDNLFTARNGYGRKHTFRCEAEVNRFWDYLVSQGYTLREAGSSLGTLKRVAAPQQLTLVV